MMARSENSGGMYRYKCKNHPKCEAVFLSNKREQALKQKAKHEKKCYS